LLVVKIRASVVTRFCPPPPSRKPSRFAYPFRVPSESFATLNLSDGAPLEWISEQMGHTEIDTTRKHYARWQAVREYAILDALNAARSQTGQKTDTKAAVAQ
jgi:hypothetical protein